MKLILKAVCAAIGLGMLYRSKGLSIAVDLLLSKQLLPLIPKPCKPAQRPTSVTPLMSLRTLPLQAAATSSSNSPLLRPTNGLLLDKVPA